MVDYLVIRRVWRAVNKTTSEASSIPAASGGVRGGRLLMVVCACALILLGLIVVVARQSAKTAMGTAKSNTQALYHPLLRVTVRVLDTPANFDDSQLLRPSGLLDSGEVKILAAPYVVVPSGSEGEIKINEFGFSNLFGGQALSLFVKPTLEAGSAYVHYSLEGLVRQSSANSNSFSRAPIRSDSLKLGELQITESHGLENGRRQLAVISVEMEVLKEDSAGNTVPTGTNVVAYPARFGPVMERVVWDRNNQTNCCIRLATGDVCNLPADAGADWVVQKRALRDSGVDFMAEITNSNPCLDGFDMTWISDDHESWDESSCAKVHELLFSGLKPDAEFKLEADVRNAQLYTRKPSGPTLVSRMIHQSFTSGGPLWTLAFKTREGSYGLLQIMGLSENQHGVKIRYKLVQTTRLPAASGTSVGAPPVSNISKLPSPRF
jgi:hypothetical protein